MITGRQNNVAATGTICSAQKIIEHLQRRGTGITIIKNITAD